MYVIHLNARQEYSLDKGPLLIGRTSDCDIFLADTQVSRKHAYIFQEQDTYVIEDLNSRNGLVVNGRTCTRSELQPKDKIIIGQHEFLVSLTPIVPEAYYDHDTDTQKHAGLPFDMGDLLADFSRQTTAEQRKLLNRIILQLNAFVDCIRIINSYLELEDILGFILKKAIEFFAAERGAILLQSSEKILIPMVSINLDREIQVNKSFSLSRSIIEQVQQRGRTILVEDALSDKTMSSESIISSRIRSILAAPMRFKDRILGIVYLDHRELAGAFLREDLHFFNAIASMSAIAVNNAERYRQRLNEREKSYQNKLFKYTEYLRAKLVSDLKQHLQKPLDTLQKQAKNLKIQAIADQVAAFSQSVEQTISQFSSMDLHAAGEMVLNMERFAPGTMVHKLYKMVFPHAYKKGIKVFVEQGQADRGFVMGDLAYMSDLFAKVVFSMVGFLSAGSELFLSLHSDGEDGMRLEITYTGAGAATEGRSLDSLLDSQIVAALKTYERIYAARILYQAQENGAARMRISLPNQLSAQAVVQGPASETAAASKEMGRRIAVMHREQYYFAVLVEYLKRNFHQVMCFHNLFEMDAVMEFSPDIMLLDYSMLESQPLHIKAVRDFKNTRMLPIILLSTTRNIDRDIFGSGIDDIMFVPFQIEELELRITHNIQNNELKQKLSTLEKVETIKAMIAGLSHEINNPLTTACINAEMVKMQQPEADKYAGRIISSLEKVKQIVQKISNIKKIAFTDYGKSQKMIKLETEEKG